MAFASFCAAGSLPWSRSGRWPAPCTTSSSSRRPGERPEKALIRPHLGRDHEANTAPIPLARRPGCLSPIPAPDRHPGPSKAPLLKRPFDYLDRLLAPFQPPAATRPEVVDERELEWKLQADSSSEPPIKRILWRRMPGRTEMEVTIDGMWNPLAGGVPTVLADGVELKVLGVGTYPAFGERGDETRIAIRLNSEAIPRTLVLMDGGGRTTMLPLLEVPLQ